MLKCNQKLQGNIPGFDIFNFLLPRDQVDDIPNLDVDIIKSIQMKKHHYCTPYVGKKEQLVGFFSRRTMPNNQKH
jgi:hypothetical protein